MKVSDELLESFRIAAIKSKHYLENGIDKETQAHAAFVNSSIRNFLSAVNGETNSAQLKTGIARSMAGQDVKEFKKIIERTLPEYV